MAKFKAAGSRKAQASNSKRGLVPCLFIVLLGLGIVFWLLYAVLTSGK
jgi:hypothetical protein